MYCQNNYTKKCLSLNQLQLLNILRRLWFEHVMWTRSFIMSAAFNLGDLDAVTKRLLRNPVDFASILKELYGNKAAMKFEELFTDHLLIAAQLVKAAKEGDTKTVEEQREKWYANANEIAKFLSEINPNWAQKTWTDLLYNHLGMTENEAIQILLGKYPESIVQYDSIQEEALKMADEMAHGIFNQFII